MLKMPKIAKVLYNIRMLDELAEKKTVIHNIHPLTKVLATCMYLLITVSFGKYNISGLLPLILYPIIILTLADIPIIEMTKRMCFALPFIIFIGIFNPVFDREHIVILPWMGISGGWVSFFSILIKGCFTILAALVLIATTGMTKIAYALRIIKVPKIFIMQLLLTYRYISVLIDELRRAMQSYSLRAPDVKGIKLKDTGSLVGQLLLRTLNRASRVYQSMCCRGFEGEYHTSMDSEMALKDILFFICWTLYFLLVRFFDIPNMLGYIMTGVIR